MDEKKRQVWRFVIQTRYLDPHGHSHGPRCDELHGRRIATARPQQNKGTRQFADGCPVSYSLICLCDFPNES